LSVGSKTAKVEAPLDGDAPLDGELPPDDAVLDELEHAAAAMSTTAQPTTSPRRFVSRIFTGLLLHIVES
jgi:hypothetical protein